MRLLCLLLLMVVPNASGEEKPSAEQSDLQKLQGEWHPEKIRLCKATAFKLPTILNITIQGNTVVRSLEPKVTLNFDLNETAQPKEMSEEKEFPVQDDPQVVRSIYKLDGGLLTICSAVGTKSSPPIRPATFDVTEGDGRSLRVYSRVK
jgi:uncharacterized protein (TIGR03067 family)